MKRAIRQITPPPIDHLRDSLYPTHTCFDDAIEIIEFFCKSNPALIKMESISLIHAVIHPPKYDIHAHAWIEWHFRNAIFQKNVYQGEKIITEFHRDTYWQNSRVLIYRKYSMKDVARLNKESGTYGPWDEVFKKYCNRPGNPT